MSAVAPALSPIERRQRNVAVLMLAITLAIAIGLLHALWWQPWSAARAQANQLAERQARAQALVAQRGPIEAALLAAEHASRQQPLWLPEGSVAQAIDGIAQRVDQSVAMVGGEGQRCRVQSRNPTPVAGDPRRATLVLRLRCGNAELLQLLYLLESGQPALLVDDLNISAPPQYPGAILTGLAGVLDVGLSVSGQVQPTASAGDAP